MEMSEVGNKGEYRSGRMDQIQIGGGAEDVLETDDFLPWSWEPDPPA